LFTNLEKVRTGLAFGGGVLKHYLRADPGLRRPWSASPEVGAFNHASSWGPRESDRRIRSSPRPVVTRTPWAFPWTPSAATSAATGDPGYVVGQPTTIVGPRPSPLFRQRAGPRSFFSSGLGVQNPEGPRAARTSARRRTRLCILYDPATEVCTVPTGPPGPVPDRGPFLGEANVETARGVERTPGPAPGGRQHANPDPRAEESTRRRQVGEAVNPEVRREVTWRLYAGGRRRRLAARRARGGLLPGRCWAGFRPT